jgi:photosystem II stability/assembly factor-like uncharacterized protein
VSSPAATTVLVASDNALVATFDSCATWAVVYTATSGNFVDAGFASADQGAAIVASPDGLSGNLLMTFDGGHSWSPMPFSQG